MEQQHGNTLVMTPYLRGYMSKAQSSDVVTALRSALERTVRLFEHVPADRTEHRYAPDKWTIKEVLQHVNDTERVFAYRALRFARMDHTALSPFDEDHYAVTSKANRLDLGRILEEHIAIRMATVAMYNGFDQDMLQQQGTAGSNSFDVYSLGLIIAGHAEHHSDIHEQRYT